MKLSGGEHKEFSNALISAFPSYKSLEMMVRYQLDQSLETIAADKGNLNEVVFELIKWAESRRLEELIEGAYKENPANPELKAFYHKYKHQEEILPRHRQSSTTQSNSEFASSSTRRRGETVESVTQREVQEHQQQQSDNRGQPFTSIPRRRFLLLFGFGGVGLIVAGLTHKFFQDLQLQTFPFETVTVDEKGNITERRSLEAKYFVEDLGKGITLEMVKIPGGTFTMGSLEHEKDRGEDEGPQRQVKVPEFFMGKYQVTQAQYQQVMGKNPSSFKGDKRPVEKVSWNDANEFCEKLNEKLSQKTGRTYRLPSEAEWEYACRAGTTTPFYFGETITTKIANYRGTDWDYQGTLYPGNYGEGPKGEFREQTTDVGKFPPNAFGLYDMHGNVWEWCQDTWHDNYKDAPKDGSAWIDNDNRSQRVLRGGSWDVNPQSCRSAYRYGLNPVNFNFLGNIGFRVVCVVSPRT
ncbi:MAG: SUMF1/EgtB/PvdO family nonheme iron enzyme [Mastigocoleus sp. MO_167.B18]|nr:SUMF1/EgtB/PvdO family nonheme iron enzyme [Mastigocoleus sp. MO_167.B18]